MLPWQTRLHIWLRLLLLQASWNFERLQGLGFFYALLPGLRKLYPAEQLASVSRRYVGYFNTHPYLAPLVAGAVLKLEEQRLGGQAEELEINEFKEMVAAPYAAIGDALFWGGLRPLVAGIALLLAVKGLLWAPLILLLLFNLVPLWFRVVFFQRGYREGMRSVERIQLYNLPDWAVRAKESAIVVLGGVSALMVYAQLELQQLPDWLGLFMLIPLVVLALTARKGVSTLLLVFIVVILISFLSLFFNDILMFHLT